ncbi:hypothetical protein [Haloarcula amylovorans]|uniref:hypothetical protein n=1 Tax=Haloarcula amylovorans TaxID=2562280 RepID=UPI0010767ABE|nr:hypothetical protein [Halomicroarcula amylolytica]
MSTYARAVDRFPTERVEQGARRIERILLALVVGCYFAGDIVTTIIGQELGAVESTESVRWAMETFGYAGLVGHKLVILACVYVGWKALTVAARSLGIDGSPFRSAYLFFFAFRGVSVVVWNSYVIFLLLTDSGAVALAPHWL